MWSQRKFQRSEHIYCCRRSVNESLTTSERGCKSGNAVWMCEKKGESSVFCFMRTVNITHWCRSSRVSFFSRRFFRSTFLGDNTSSSRRRNLHDMQHTSKVFSLVGWLSSESLERYDRMLKGWLKGLAHQCHSTRPCLVWTRLISTCTRYRPSWTIVWWK